MNPFDQFDHPQVRTSPITGPRAAPPQTATRAAIETEELKQARLKSEDAQRQHDIMFGNGAAIPGDTTKHGDAYLATVPPAIATQAKALGTGRMAFPSGFALSKPYWQQMLQVTAQAYPDFDVANPSARIAGRKAWTEGKQGQGLLSAATALDHLATWDKAIGDLGNVRSPVSLTTPLVNSVRNAFDYYGGGTRVTGYEATAGAQLGELVRAFRGAGGSEADIQRLEHAVPENGSQPQQRAAIQQWAKLLQGRINESIHSYNTAMGTVGEMPPGLPPDALSRLNHFIDPDYVSHGLPAPAAGADGHVAPIAGPPGTPPPGTPPHGGSPSTPQGPLDPQGTGDIGFAGQQPNQDTQNHIVPIPQDKLDQFAQFVGTLHPKTMADHDLSGLLNSKFQEITGRPMTNADAAAHAFNQGGSIGAGIQYDPTATDRQAMDAQQQEAALEAKQNISDVRGAGGVGESLDAGARGIANAASLGLTDKLAALGGTVMGGTYADNLARQRAIDNYDSQHHFIAQLSGNALGFGADEAAMGRVALPGRLTASLTPRVGAALSAARPAMTDAALGAGTGAISSDGSFGDRVEAALSGGALAGSGGMLGRGIARGVAGVVSPVAPAVIQRLNAAGIALTPGQIFGASDGVLGRFLKGAEDKATSRFGLGDLIANARRGGIEDFNIAAGNDALSRLGTDAGGKAVQTIPADVQAGRPMIQHLQDVGGKAYDEALAPLRAMPDDQIANDIADIRGRVRPDQLDAFDKTFGAVVAPHLPADGPMTGAQLQMIKRGLNEKIAKYGQDANGSDLADDLSNLRDSFLNFAKRSDPANADAYARADSFHSALSRIEAAAAAGKGGVFSPQQFRTAVSRRGYGTTTANLAAGSAPMQQLADDASAVLPSTVPDSGTAGRVIAALSAPAVGGILGGGGGYENGGAGEALGGAALGAAMFSRPGGFLIQKTLAGSRGKTLNTLGDFLRNGASVGPINVVAPQSALGNLVAPWMLQSGSAPAANAGQ